MMQNKRGITLLYKILIGIIIFLFLFTLAFQMSKYTGNSISTQPTQGQSELYDQIGKVYEISQNALETGTFIPVQPTDALRLKYMREDYTILITNITKNTAGIYIFGKGTLVMSFDKSYIVDLENDGIADIEVFMNKTQQGISQMFIKRYDENSILLTGDYYELFDVTMRLQKSLIYSSQELGAFIIFENFGDGPSKIDIVYTITDQSGKEVYRGVDIRVVQTQDSVFKSFEFLNLNYGLYTLKAEIFYGNEQTASAKQQFKIIPVPISAFIKEPLIFTIAIIILFCIIILLRRTRRQ